MTVSPNGVDMELFGSPPAPDEGLRRSLGLGGKSVLGFIGSFYDYEGLDDLIAAMPMLREYCPDVHLLLVGGGPMEAALKDQVANSPCREAITFTGRVEHDAVERYYSLMDVMVYPRKSMRLTDLVTPLKPLEAMAQGRIVAASDVGGHKELIKDGVTGTLFPAGNPEKIAKKLGKLLENREQWPQTIETAKEFVRMDRNWSSNILRYNPVYQRLLADKRFEQAA
ncbi:Glycosyl transferase, group 1 [hydrothermal vent metagenome]|uniref:Glycosyl transferase, group 1 n=1 Tax=hydrothermal vent metagenome TaxID=652676 RepID=A0A3B0SI63_9ZZZZ